MDRPIQDFFVEHNVFKNTLILSLFIHLLIVIRVSYVMTHNAPKILRHIDMTYHNTKIQTKRDDDSIKAKKQEAKAVISKKTEAFLEKRTNAAVPIKDISKFIDKVASFNKQPAMLSELHIKRKVSVPVLKSEKINNPVYQNYYEAVRNIIKKRAYTNYSKLDTGEVYLTFVILSDGTVKQVQLVEEKTSAGDYLKDISLKSVEESNPFPSFPQDLTYPELSFNVAISFELEE